MANPIQRALLDLSTTPKMREIDRTYHVQMIAEDTRQIRNYHASALRFQAEAAAVNLKTAALNLLATGELARRQDETNSHLNRVTQGMAAAAHDFGSLVHGVDAMNAGIGRLVDGIGDLAEIAHETRAITSDIRSLTVAGNVIAANTLAGVHQLSGIVNEGLDRISQQMFQQQETLRQIVQILSHPYGTQAGELRREAIKWLTNGMKGSGRDRREDWNDAIRLLRTVIENPIGMQDCSAWFQLGWLLWKHDGAIERAEDAFYRAQRLSAPDRNGFHRLSLRHLAHMQYMLAKYEDAYETGQKTLGVYQDHDVMFDAARYAAKTTREQEAVDLLGRCIDLQPTTIVTMCSEDDFQPILAALADLASRKLVQQRQEATSILNQWGEAVEQVHAAALRAGFSLELPVNLAGRCNTLRSQIDDADYLSIFPVIQEAKNAIATLPDILRDAHRLHESRVHAKAMIQRWQNSIELAQKSLRQANCQTALEPNLIERVDWTNGTFDDIKTNQEISKAAAFARQEVLNTTLRILKDQVEACRKEASYSRIGSDDNDEMIQLAPAVANLRIVDPWHFEVHYPRELGYFSVGNPDYFHYSIECDIWGPAVTGKYTRHFHEEWQEFARGWKRVNKQYGTFGEFERVFKTNRERFKKMALAAFQGIERVLKNAVAARRKACIAAGPNLAEAKRVAELKWKNAETVYEQFQQAIS